MKISELIKTSERVVRENSPAILTAIGISGTITTAYLTGRATYEAAYVIMYEEAALTTGALERRDKVELVWRLYIPAALSGTLTIACIIGATRVGSRRTAALTAAYSLSDKAFTEYRDKVIETIGEKKHQSIKAAVAQDHVDREKPPEQHMIFGGTGLILCCENFTGRYFLSDMEELRKAQNDINAKLLRHDAATLDDFYHIIGVKGTSYSGNIGWTSDRQLDLEFATALSDDNRPCITFDYNYTKPL